MTITLYGEPRTKKNSQRIAFVRGRVIPLTSKAYDQFRSDCLKQITGDKQKQVNFPVNVRCVYYMQTRRRVDLVNLLEATCDILVDAHVLQDDNSRIIVSHDGSRVLYDPKNPRTEIEITEA